MSTSLNDAFAPPNPSFDKKFAVIAYSIVIVITIITTYMHHLKPEIFRVPSNTDIASWQYPPFEDTYLYDHMTEAEREKFLAEGVPHGDNLVYQFIVDILTFLLGYMVFLHAVKYCGFWMSACFLIGSFVFTGLEESMFIIVGRFLPPDIVNAFGEPVTGTYWFTKGFFWFFECPFKACIAWFIIAYSCVLTAGKVFPNRGLIFRAAIGGLIAMMLDLWMDPVVTTPELVEWLWPKGGHLIILGIPDSNFVGWFNLIFLFAIFWEMLPKLEAKLGRAKATVAFFLILLVTEIAIAIFMLVYSTVLGEILKALGYTSAVMIPSGW